MAEASAAGSPPFGISFTRVTGRTRCAFPQAGTLFPAEKLQRPLLPPGRTHVLWSQENHGRQHAHTMHRRTGQAAVSSQSFTEGCLGTVTNCTSRTYSSSARRSSVPGWSAFNQRASAEPGSSEPYTTRTGDGREGAAEQETERASISARPGNARAKNAMTAKVLMNKLPSISPF